MANPPDEIRARATLPGMTLEIVHRPADSSGPESMGLLIKGQASLPWLALWGLSAGQIGKR